jgi:hypothetical protein
MSNFSEEVRDLYRDVGFPPMRSSKMRTTIFEMVQVDPVWEGLVSFLQMIPIYQFKQYKGRGDYTRFFPPNIAVILEDLNIESLEDAKEWSTHVFEIGEEAFKYFIPPTFSNITESVEQVTFMEIGELVKSQCLVGDDFNIEFGDAYYGLPPKEYVEDVLDRTYFDREPYILKTMTIDDKPWQRYLHDCDDFSRSLSGRFAHSDLSGLALGELKVRLTTEEGEVKGAHAINFFVDDTKRVWMIEPQSDQIFSPDRVFKRGGLEPYSYQYIVYDVDF